jgi:hypothetical protein
MMPSDLQPGCDKAALSAARAGFAGMNCCDKVANKQAVVYRTSIKNTFF